MEKQWTLIWVTTPPGIQKLPANTETRIQRYLTIEEARTAAKTYVTQKGTAIYIMESVEVWSPAAPTCERIPANG